MAELGLDAVKPLYLRTNLRSEIDRLGYNQAERALTQEFADRGYVVFDLDLPDFDALADDIIRNVTFDPNFRDGVRNCSYYTPLHSDPGLGKIFRRHVVDIRTNDWVDQRHFGRRIPVPVTRRVFKMFRS